MQPVDTDDIVQGAVKFLQDKPEILAVLGTYPGASIPYLFQRQLWIDVEGTSSTAAYLYSEGGWTSANMHNTMHFPRLSLEIWADPLRDEQNNVTDPGEVWRRINVAYAAFDKYLHRPQGGRQWWGSIRSIDSVRMAEPITYEVPDGDGLLRLLVSYAVTHG